MNNNALNANHGNVENGCPTEYHEPLRCDLIGDNILGFILSQTKTTINEGAINMFGVTFSKSSNDLISVPMEYICDNTPSMTLKNTREMSHDPGEKNQHAKVQKEAHGNK